MKIVLLVDAPLPTWTAVSGRRAAAAAYHPMPNRFTAPTVAYPGDMACGTAMLGLAG